MRSISMRSLWFAALLVGLATAPGAARATVITGSSSAYDGTFALSVNGSGGGGSGPVSNVSGISQAGSYAPYSLSDPQTFPSLNQPVSVGSYGTLDVILGSAATDTTASSNVDGSSGAKTTGATSTITGPDTITITFTPSGSSTAQTWFTASVPLDFMSSASVTGDYGSLAATASSSITQSDPVTIWGTLFGNSYSTAWTLSGSVPANTVYWDDGIVRLVLNEQTTNCSGPSGGTDSCSISVNAMHFTIDDPTGTLFNGNSVYTDLVVGHSQALQVAALPEPGLGLLLLGGLAGFAAARRRGHQTS